MERVGALILSVPETRFVRVVVRLSGRILARVQLAEGTLSLPEDVSMRGGRLVWAWSHGVLAATWTPARGAWRLPEVVREDGGGEFRRGATADADCDDCDDCDDDTRGGRHP